MEDKARMNLTEIRCDDLDWLKIGTMMNTVMTLKFHKS
jgi:hypothetical protein